jgi:hypothetical protein
MASAIVNDEFLRLAERAFQHGVDSARCGLDGPLRNSRHNENREVALQWFQIASALRSRAHPLEGE